MRGIRNGTEIGYDLGEVARMLGQRDLHCADGRDLIQRLSGYFRQEHLIEARGLNSYDVVSGGAIRAYCYDHDQAIPRELEGTAPSADEVKALMRKMLRDMVGAACGTPEAADKSAASPAHKRKRGGDRPETVFFERYVRQCAGEGLTLHAMRTRFVRYVGDCIEARDPECPFTQYDPVRSEFTVWGADGTERTLSLAAAHRSIGDAKKRIRGRKQW